MSDLLLEIQKVAVRYLAETVMVVTVAGFYLWHRVGLLEYWKRTHDETHGELSRSLQTIESDIKTILRNGKSSA